MTAKRKLSTSTIFNLNEVLNYYTDTRTFQQVENNPASPLVINSTSIYNRPTDQYRIAGNRRVIMPRVSSSCILISVGGGAAQPLFG